MPIADRVALLLGAFLLLLPALDDVAGAVGQLGQGLGTVRQGPVHALAQPLGVFAVAEALVALAAGLFDVALQRLDAPAALGAVGLLEPLQAVVVLVDVGLLLGLVARPGCCPR